MYADLSYTLAQKGVLTIMYIDKEISYIDTMAYKDGRLVDNNGLIQHGNTLNPFLKGNIRMAAAVLEDNRLYLDKPYTFNFLMPKHLNNDTQALDSIKVEIINTSNSFAITPTASKSISFSGTAGKGVLKISIYGKGGSLLWEGDHLVTLSTSADIADAINSSLCMSYKGKIKSYEPYWGEREGKSLYGEGEMVVWHSSSNCAPNKKITKPVILSDAWDPQDERIPFRPFLPPGKITYNDIYHDRMYYTDSYGVQKNMIDELNAMGYDVIVVNYNKVVYDSVLYEIIMGNPLYLYKYIDGGTDYIYRNAMTFVSVIQEVKARMALSGSTEEMIVVGPSMGGQITRIALKYMEDKVAAGIPSLNHRTRLWVSFDSPHHGANIPIGLQETLKYMGDDRESESAKEFLTQQLRAPAAREMLIHQIGNPGDDWTSNEANRNGQNGKHLAYYSYINSLGYPNNLRRIAIANGRYTGGEYHIPGSQMFNLKIYKNPSKSWTLLNNRTYFANNDESNLTYNEKFKITFGFIGLMHDYSLNTTINHPNGYKALDGAPGGMYDVQKALYKELDNQWVGLGTLILGKGYASVYEQTHNACFIPTYSALAIINKNIDWKTSFDINKLVCNNNTPFHSVFAPRENEGHTDLTAANVAYLKEEIQYGQQGCPNICSDSIKRQDGVSPLTFLCPNIEYIFTLDEWIPTNATAVWSASPGITFVGGNTGNTVVIKYTGTVPVTEDGYLEVVITPRLGSAQCAAKKTIRQKISYGNDFNIVLSTDSGTATQFTATVLPNYPGNTYSWSPDNGVTWSGYVASNVRVFNKTNITSPVPQFKVRIKNAACSSYISELTKDYMLEGFAPAPLKPMKNTAITIRPNPTKNNWTVSLPITWENENQILYSIYSTDGKLLSSNNTSYTTSIIIDGSSLSSGIYILHIQNGSHQEKIKLVKQ